MNFELKVKEISVDTYILTSKINDRNIINNLINFIRKTKDEKLSYKTQHIKASFTGFTSLIDNLDFHNFLKIIQPKIKIIYPDNFRISQAWGNICKRSEEITEHDHRNVGVFCGILYLSEGGPGTYFKDYDLTISEEIGKYVLFHPYLLHSVKKIEKDIERITVAFNMNQIKKWDDLTNAKWVNKNEI